MDLIIDIGNTRTKLALFSGGTLQKFYAFENPNEEILESIKQQKINRGIISSVSGKVDFWMETFPKVDWIVLSPETKVPFTNRYETPKTLGLDRIALVAAAATKYPQQNVLIIDAGTCVTYDLLTANGEYLGGEITPGLQMRLKAMHNFTAKLPLVQVNPSVLLTGASTEKSLQSGALNGLAAELDGMISRYSNQFENLIIVLTGGDTKVLAPLVKSGIFAPRKFLLEGLHGILAYNTP